MTTSAPCQFESALFDEISQIEHENTEWRCHTIYEFVNRTHGDSMRSTTEGSEWHREANVWVHTCMAATEFLRAAKEQDFSIDMLVCGFLAIMYHDVGKPNVATPHDTIAGRLVSYRHEVNSANVFKNDYLQSKIISSLCGTPQMMQFVRFLIQSHLPYTIGKDLRIFKASLKFYGKNAGFSEIDTFSIFTTMLIGDNYGRISDDHEEKKASLHEWIADEFDASESVYLPQSIRLFGLFDGSAIIISGPPAAGKSTLARQFGGNVVVFSYDSIRQDICNEHFGHLNPENTEERDFVERKLNAYFQKYVKDWNKHSIDTNNRKLSPVVDATMVTRKRRLFAGHTCRHQGNGFAYRKIEIIDLNLPFHEHVARNSKRTGHEFVPFHILKQNYFSATLPWVDEFDTMAVAVNDQFMFIASHF